MKKGFIFGAVNPIHNAHIKVMELGLKHADFIYLHVGKKPNLKGPPLNERVNIAKIALGKYPVNVSGDMDLQEDYKMLKYDYFIVGSDILNLIKDGKTTILKEFEKELFFKGGNIVVINRPGHELEDKARAYVKTKVNLYEEGNDLTHSGEDIREKIKKGEPITGLVPANIEDKVLEIYSLYFKTEAGLIGTKNIVL